MKRTQVLESVHNEQKNLLLIEKAFKIQNVTPFNFFDSDIRKSSFSHAYAKLLTIYSRFDFNIFLQDASEWDRNTIKKFHKAADSILIKPLQVRASEFRNIPHHLFKISQSLDNISFNKDPKFIETVNFLKALIIIFRLWKTLAKNSLSKLDVNHLSVNLRENRNIQIRLNNKFNYKKLINILAEVAELSLINSEHKTSLNSDSDGTVNFLDMTFGDHDSKKFFYKNKILERNIFEKKFGPPRTVKLIIYENKKPVEKILSLDERLMDDARQPAFFKRFVTRSITPYERLYLSEIAYNLDPPLKINLASISQLKDHPHANIFFKKHSTETMVKLLQDYPEIASFFLILHGVHKFFLCCSDTLKKTLPITSNHHKSFTTNGETYVSYMMNNGAANPDYKIEGGGEIIIDCALIPANKKIIAPRAHAGEQDFMGINTAILTSKTGNKELKQETINKARTVSFRNYEVHLESIPSAAIIAWRSSENDNWQKSVQTPFILHISSQKTFKATLQFIYNLEHPEIPKPISRAKKRKERPESTPMFPQRKKTHLASLPIKEKNDYKTSLFQKKENQDHYWEKSQRPRRLIITHKL